MPIATFLVGIFLGAALVKPWDLFFPAPTPAIAQRPTVSASAGPSPSPSPTPPPAECAFAGGWRVFALGAPDLLGGDGSTGAAGSSASTRRPDGHRQSAPTLAGGGSARDRVRAGRPAHPVRHDRLRPDRRDRLLPAAGRQRRPAGRCPVRRLAARRRRHAGGPAHSTAPPWARRPRSGSPCTSGRIRRRARSEHWPAGRYIFAVEGSDLASYARWFGVEIRSPPGKLSS